MAGPSPSGWEGILAPGERILWQGRPEARLDWSFLLSRQTPKGLFIALIALIWMGLAFSITSQGNAPWLIRLAFPLFGVPILLTGVKSVLGPALARWRRLQGSTYTLTDRHAFIAIEIAGQHRMERYSLHDGSLSPALEDGTPGSVWFQTRPAMTGGWFSAGASVPGAVGFECIPEARHVFRMMLDAMSRRPDAAAPPSPPPPPPPEPPPEPPPVGDPAR